MCTISKKYNGHPTIAQRSQLSQPENRVN